MLLDCTGNCTYRNMLIANNHKVWTNAQFNDGSITSITPIAMPQVHCILYIANLITTKGQRHDIKYRNMGPMSRNLTKYS